MITHTNPRVALVSGGNRGLGLAIATRLAEQGMQVVLGVRDRQAGREAEEALGRQGLFVHHHELDVTDPASVARAIADVAAPFGRLDVLVNNAAVAIDRGQAASAPDFERVRATMDANLLGAWRLSAAAVPEMRKNGYGRIVNITSHLGSQSNMGTGNVSYRISKAGLNALTQILAAELTETGILVNAASPGRMDTRMAYGETKRTPDEAADTPVWLATLPDDGPTGGLFYERQPLDW
ncbi:SDR family NAD(P)-dependent oxidoreductase [Streptomyces sp. NBC_00102]|uniref:SDR family NAD(P)-dependent oxidoreductase n=1 Tax=Streptomyces sp. NBC_00102 TaxID=2975652 RepID=UPI0022518E6A|nr:SDR family NAD(P)-dependent oxidoreductase [Streptomyces sp. NBC_00102]MCX5397198.1 SDR family NAD(P)-dependent oxidoreductase [Streptomyces sp. NBC_00102]